MLFSNLTIYEIESLPSSLESGLGDYVLQEYLARMPFKPLGDHEAVTRGWVPPIAGGKTHTHSVHEATCICCCEESKVLPASVLQEKTKERVAEIEEAEGRTIKRRERNKIRDDVYLEMMPHAFHKKRYTYAYLHWPAGLLVVDSGSWPQAEELTELLRACFGTLVVQPLQTDLSPQRAMTDWLQTGKWPNRFMPAEHVALEDPTGAGKARVTHQDVESPDVLAHIKAGKLVRQLGLSYADRLAFKLDSDLSMKSVKYLDAVKDEIAESDVETAEERFDADFCIMVKEVQGLVYYIQTTLSELGI